MSPSPGGLIFSKEGVPIRVRSGAPNTRPDFGKCHPRPGNFRPNSGSRTSGTHSPPPPTPGPELRGSLAPPPTPKFRGLPATSPAPGPEFRDPLVPPPYPRPGTSGTPQPLPTPGPELWEPSHCALSDPDSGTSGPLRPLKPRNFGAPQAAPSLPVRNFGDPRALPLALAARAPRVPGAGSDSRAHPASSAPRECPGASRVLPRGADSPQPGAPLACWLRGPRPPRRPPRRPPHRPRLCLRLRRRPRRLRSHRGRSRRGRRPPRLPGPPRPPRSAPCRPSAAAGRGRGRGGSREAGGTGPAGRGLRAGKRDWGWRMGTETPTQRQRYRGETLETDRWRMWLHRPVRGGPDPPGHCCPGSHCLRS